MKATDLQHSLAHLAAGETLLLPATEIEQAFHFYMTSEERSAAARLAELYRCSFMVCEPDRSQICFTRYSG